jgi:hypothetical protein
VRQDAGKRGARNDMTVAEAERWPAPNLNYDPA